MNEIPCRSHSAARAAHPDAALPFAPDDAAGLDKALERLARDEAWRTAAIAAGKAAARAFDWAALSAKLVAFYGHL